MSDKRASLEIIAPTVEEALAKGLSDLGLTEEEVEVEVLDEGSRGLFGLRARQARIRLTIKTPVPEEVEVPAQAQAFEMPSLVETAEPEVVSSPAPTSGEEGDEEEGEEGYEEDTLRVARETVAELLDKMKVKAHVSASFGEAEDARSRIPILVEVNGNDLSILIGRQAETLNALQYIASLMIGKELGHSVPVVIDVEGYRQRRAQQLRQLARRMADQAVKTGRRQILEPMPANERRLIHIELRDHPGVTTESIGEEPRRKVTIIPK
jgi:spoIIIJ-associated protein